MPEVTLSVLSVDSLSPPTIISVRFDKDGGTIGRDDGNTMALPDKLRRVSRLHGTITFVDGRATLSNSSTSLPIMVGDQQLDYGEAIRITDGMHIEFGPYVLVAALASARPPMSPVRDALIANPFTGHTTAVQTKPASAPVAPAIAAVAAPLIAAPAPIPMPPIAAPVFAAPPPQVAPPVPPVSVAPSPMPRVLSAEDARALDPLQGLLGAAPSPILERSSTTHQLSQNSADDPFASLLRNNASISSRLPGEPQLNGALTSEASNHSSVSPVDDPLASLGISSAPRAAPSSIPRPLSQPFAPTPSAPAQMIPDDFNPFDMPSAAPRNSSDPLSEMLNAPPTASEAALRGDGIAPPIESLFAPQSISSADPFAAFSDAPPVKSLDGTIGSLTRSDGATDPLALFGEAALAPHVQPMRDDTLEIGSAFQPPNALIPDSMPQMTPALPADPFLSARGNFAPSASAPQIPVRTPVEAKIPVTPAVASSPMPAAFERRPMQATAPAIPSTAPTMSTMPPAMPDAATTDALTRAFLEGAELQPHALAQGLTPEAMRVIGSLLRSATAGAIDMLAARAATKREVQANVTIIAVSANNPLKFLPNADAALQQLLGKKMPGFMRSDIAMRDAFDDLRAHEIGVIAGTRSALTEVLGKFDPAILGDKLTKGSVLEALMPSARKAKLWDMYLERYEQIRREAEDDFQSVFGKAFVEAYERETQRVKGVGGDQ
jgi:FHA domain-containing protein